MPTISYNKFGREINKTLTSWGRFGAGALRGLKKFKNVNPIPLKNLLNFPNS